MSRDAEVFAVLREHRRLVVAHARWHARAGAPTDCYRCGRDGDLDVTSIARRAGMPRRSARRAIERLVDAGLVEIVVDVAPGRYADGGRFRACDGGGTSEMHVAPSRDATTAPR